MTRLLPTLALRAGYRRDFLAQCRLAGDFCEPLGNVYRAFVVFIGRRGSEYRHNLVVVTKRGEHVFLISRDGLRLRFGRGFAFWPWPALDGALFNAANGLTVAFESLEFVAATRCDSVNATSGAKE